MNRGSLIHWSLELFFCEIVVMLLEKPELTSVLIYFGSVLYFYWAIIGQCFNSKDSVKVKEIDSSA